jgi:hypothetical protein
MAHTPCHHWIGIVIGTLAALGATSPGLLHAHCDTLDGPVVQDARRALESGDAAPVLKWIRAEDEAGIEEAFTAALHVRKLGDEAREMADRYFFETLVRVHRASEGESYEGLRPAGSIPEEILAADHALESGSVEDLSRQLSASVAEAVHSRFEAAADRKAHAEDSAEAGRDFVSAYVEFVHYVEAVSAMTGGAAHPHEQGELHSAHHP